MNLEVQPQEVQDRNGKLILLVVILMLPFMCWILTADIRHAPRWLPLSVYLGNFVFIGSVVHFARKRMIRAAKRRNAELDLNIEKPSQD